MDCNDFQPSSIFRSISVASAAFAALALPAAPAPAALLHLSCSMTVTQRDVLHPQKYAYYTSVDEDAGRAYDELGAYLLYPTTSGDGYVWFARANYSGSVAWTTQYYWSRTTGELYVADQSDIGNTGNSTGVCAAG